MQQFMVLIDVECPRIIPFYWRHETDGIGTGIGLQDYDWLDALTFLVRVERILTHIRLIHN